MNQPIIIPMEDDLVHLLPERPFCLDSPCPCHTDSELLREYIGEPIMDGLLTVNEAMDLWSGKQVGA